MMRAAWYETQGPADEVLVAGEMPEPEPGVGEVRIRVRASGVNLGDIKKRQGWLGSGMRYPRVIPHSDGAGEIDAVGPEVSTSLMCERVWCHGAQSYRPFGTAAEFVCVPERQAIHLPGSVGFEIGACLGIPGITAHRALFADGPIDAQTILVAGAVGTVGSIATQLAAWAGATVLGTVTRADDVDRAKRLGAAYAFLLGEADVASAIRCVAPDGVQRIIEVALSANAELDAAVIAQGGVIAVYASRDPDPRLPFWELLFQNTVVRLLGSDDFPRPAKDQAANDINACLEEERLRVEIATRFPLNQIAAAHNAVEHPSRPGRIVVTID
jgi:NADPH2:quinone reductase